MRKYCKNATKLCYVISQDSLKSRSFVCYYQLVRILKAVLTIILKSYLLLLAGSFIEEVIWSVLPADYCLLATSCFGQHGHLALWGHLVYRVCPCLTTATSNLGINIFMNTWGRTSNKFLKIFLGSFFIRILFHTSSGH